MAAASNSGKTTRAEARNQRLAAELKANIGKRKVQARARQATGKTADETGGVASLHREPDGSGRP